MNENDVRLGEEVRRLLEHEAVIAAFERLDAEYVGDLVSCAEPEKLPALQAKVQAHRRLKQELQSIVDTGVLAAEALHRAERRAAEQ